MLYTVGKTTAMSFSPQYGEAKFAKQSPKKIQPPFLGAQRFFQKKSTPPPSWALDDFLNKLLTKFAFSILCRKWKNSPFFKEKILLQKLLFCWKYNKIHTDTYHGRIYVGIA